MSGRIGLALAALLAARATGVAADETPQVVRLLGSAPTAEDAPAKVFVLDLRLRKGEGAFQKTVSGWYAALPPQVGSGSVSGTCVHSACAIDIDQDEGKLSLSGDLAGAANEGRFAVSEDDKVKAEGMVRFAPLAGEVPGVGALAAPDAVSGAEFKSLIEWTGSNVSFGNADPPEWPDDSQREALASWQNSAGEPMTGLITVADLATLRANAKAAQAKAGWTPLGGIGWSAGYPAALLPKTSTNGPERRFASPDGQAVLTVEVGPGVSDDDFSALVEKLTADSDARKENNYTRVNNDLDLSYVEGGHRYVVACHNREGGMVRLTFSHPAGADEAWSLYDVVLPTQLSVSDDLKAP
jgi:hypothetical protein